MTTELIRWGFVDEGKDYEVVVYHNGTAKVFDMELARAHLADKPPEERILSAAFSDHVGSAYARTITISFDLYLRLRDCKKILEFSDDAEIAARTQKEITDQLHDLFTKQKAATK